MAALRKRGLKVQPFKCGPDFIDGGHHTRVCGRPSRNLDGWMLSSEANREMFYRATVGADVCVVEGVMGLFEGVDGKSEAGSSAEIAKLLDLPVVLVLDASSMARSAAALVHGFQTFDPKVRLSGVIFNKIAGMAHYALLRDALESSCHTAPLGYLPRDERILIPERYLGLFTAGESLLPDSAFSLLRELAESSIEIDKLLEGDSSLSSRKRILNFPRVAKPAVRIGVARDQAFCFYYEDNLDALRGAGAEIVESSPLADFRLAEEMDALYFGGGYPELYAERLTANREMLASVRQFANEGWPIYAECGGLMYLAGQIESVDHKAFPMARVLPLRVKMTERLVHFGYGDVYFAKDCLLGPAGAKARGHSCHCSVISEAEPLERACHLRYSLTGVEETEGYCINNVLASYIHLHFLSNPGLATAFVEKAQRAKEKRVSRMLGS